MATSAAALQGAGVPLLQYHLSKQAPASRSNVSTCHSIRTLSNLSQSTTRRSLLRFPTSKSNTLSHKDTRSGPIPVRCSKEAHHQSGGLKKRADIRDLAATRDVRVRASQTDQAQEASSVPNAAASQNGAMSSVLVGEDAGVFDVTAQKTSSWVNFTIVLAVVLAILYVIWIDPNTGFGGKFVDALEGALGGSHEATMIGLLFIFAIVHSGGAALRAKAEEVIGERAYRVLFAGLSLPLAVSSVVYFINHRYDGTQLWQLRTVPGAHELVWIVSFISFFFLYPSTFNLLEVAAVDKPKLHMWETGIMRITRHPQMTGQLLWCLAHTLWIGNSFTLVTSLGLCAHHLFGVWHGDRRLEAKYGDAFQAVKSRTSIVPFQAIIEGRQKMPADWYKEYLRVPYFVIVGVTLGAYFSHPLMQAGSFWLHW